MKESITLSHNDGMSFETELDGHKIVLDAAAEFGGQDRGPRPKPLMLVALAGCTAMDVISILNKMRVELEDFKVSVEGDLTEEHPKHYQKMHIVYQFKGKNLPRGKLERAVNLSTETYCGVHAVYKKAMELTTEIKILED